MVAEQAGEELRCRLRNRSATAEDVLAGLLADAQKKHVSAYDIGVVYTGLRQKDRAFEWLRQASDQHAGFVIYVYLDWRFQCSGTTQAFKPCFDGFSNQRAYTGAPKACRTAPRSLRLHTERSACQSTFFVPMTRRRPPSRCRTRGSASRELWLLPLQGRVRRRTSNARSMLGSMRT